MKKLLPILLILLLLFGCASNSTSQISNKEEVLFKIEDREVTKGDVYDMIRFQNISSELIVSEAQKRLIDSKVEITDEIKETAKQNLSKAHEQMGEFFAYQYGNATDEELLETMFIPAAQQEVFIRQYISDNQEQILKDDQPVKLHVLYFDDETNANDALKKLNENVDIKEIITSHGSQKNANSNRIDASIQAKSKLPKIIQDFIVSAEGKELNWSKAVLKDENGFYLVKLVSDDSQALAADYQNVLLSDSQALQAMMLSIFKKAKFEVYDQAIYDAIKNSENLKEFTPDN